MIANSVINIQSWYGTIPNVHLHGNCAKSVYELISRLNQITTENRSSYKATSEYKIGNLILIDRSLNLFLYIQLLLFENSFKNKKFSRY